MIVNRLPSQSTALTVYTDHAVDVTLNNSLSGPNTPTQISLKVNNVQSSNFQNRSANLNIGSLSGKSAAPLGTSLIQPYPLYDELVKRVESRTEKSIDIKRICTTINNIGQTLPSEEAASHYREIGALILHHELLANNGVLLSSIPFEGKVMVGGKGVLHYIMNLPPNLQQIIAQYVENPDAS